MEKEFNVNKYLEPSVYAEGTEEYKELSSLEGVEWSEFLDELAKHGMTCNYCPLTDTYTIG